jgi:disulfide bond formation protein DsbB
MITPERMSLFFALLTVVVQIAVLKIVSTAALAHWAPSSRTLAWRKTVFGWFQPNELWLAWLVAAVATLGSLYFSEVAHFTPCRLCWYQRIGMYPLSIVLLIAAFHKDRGIRRYVLPIVSIAGVISAYHVLIERYPSLEKTACDIGNPCTLIWFKRFGYITLPVMALSAFVFIGTMMVLARPQSQQGAPPSSPE